MNGRIDSLERLARLHQDGVLTDAEFALERRDCWAVTTRDHQNPRKPQKPCRT